MATSAEEKRQFAERLNAAAARSRKRITTPTTFANAFNLRWNGTAVTVQAAQKWLQGTAMPANDKLQVMAEMLKVPLQWLRFGIAVQGPERRLRVAEGGTEDVRALSAGALTVEELRLVARLRAMPEHRRRLVTEMVVQLALETEMWERG